MEERERETRGEEAEKKKTILPDLHLNHSRSCHGDADSSTSRCLTFLWPLPSNQGEDRVGTPAFVAAERKEVGSEGGKQKVEESRRV